MQLELAALYAFQRLSAAAIRVLLRCMINYITALRKGRKRLLKGNQLAIWLQPGEGQPRAFRILNLGGSLGTTQHF